jgi:GH24 family phage-related lysozyme (muramidase)
METFSFYSQLTRNYYKVVGYGSALEHAGVSNSYATLEEAEKVLARFVLDEWKEINSIVAAGAKGWTFGIGSRSLWMNDELNLSAGFGLSPGMLFGSDPLSPFLSMASALHAKKEELEKKLKSAIRSDHPMVAIAAKMAGHLGHGWAGFDGATLAEIEQKMDEYEEGLKDSTFGAGLRPQFHVSGVKDGYPYSHDGEIAMGSTSGTGRYDWSVDAKGTLRCDICRPGGTAIHIVIVQHDGGVAVEVKRGGVEFSDRHLEHAGGVIAACAGADFVKPAMTESLLSADEFDAWQQRRKATCTAEEKPAD